MPWPILTRENQVIRFIMLFMFSITYPSLAQGPRGVDLAKMDGWDIVVSPDATASEAYAATEFQQLYKQASGVELPIVRKTDRPDRHIFIGPGQAMQSAPGVGFSVWRRRYEAARTDRRALRRQWW